ncbi:MAG: prepilin peptidase [Leptolyngbyaceae cyanobacterium HOT.MB2.61]|jgi:leader peptidase (prepilin peptidase)/N-methyltransferase|nr:prepilin peptidase [Leptolyngbyaceae cyanobacterium HOT.MB2.61]
MDFLFELPAMVVVLFLGASVGSFLNVVVYRLPAGLSLLHPPSRCPKCLNRLRKRENIPVLGWLWLRGRCAHCGNPISVRYPLVEGVTGILFVLTFWLFGWSWQTVGYWFFLSWLLALSLIDLDTMTLPNPLTQSGLVAGLVFQVILGFSTTATLAGAIAQLMHGVVGIVLGLWLVDLISLVGSVALGQTAMGGGDARLAAMMGAWLGWKLLLLAGFLACAVGAFVGGGAIALGLLNHRQPMPFGPFLALGALLTVFWGDAIIATYMHIFFPFA